MERNWKSSALGIAGTLLMMGGVLLAPQAAQAGADGRKNTTIALGAAAAWELLHHQTLAGVALGAGTVYAEKKYEDARRSERDTKNRQYYYENNNRVPYGSYNNRRYNNSNNSYNNNGYSTDSQDYERNNGGNYHRHDNRTQNNDRDQQHGRKQGWNGHNMPPGQWKKHHHDDNDN